MENTGTGLTSISRATMLGVFYTELCGLLWDMRWLILFSIVLIVVDLWWGLSKAIKRKEEIRASRAIRRTLIKLVDYVCILMLGAVAGQAFEPLGLSHVTVAVICMLVACCCEMDSIHSNYCECKGIKRRFSFNKLVNGIIGMKSKEIKDILENSKENEKDEKQD